MPALSRAKTSKTEEPKTSFAFDTNRKIDA